MTTCIERLSSRLRAGDKIGTIRIIQSQSVGGFGSRACY